MIEPLNDILRDKITLDEISNRDIDNMASYLTNKIISEYEEKIESIPDEIKNEFEKAIHLRVIDTYWMEHINTMSHLKEGIFLRSYAQNDPLREYKTEGYELFEKLLEKIDAQTTVYLLKAEVRQNSERQKVAEGVTNENSTKVKKKSPKRVEKIGRNEPCPCGSGKKYKNCCGR